MNESELKRYLIRSLEAAGGLGHRFEDKYKVGFPDTLLLLPDRPPVFAEMKIVRGAKLDCTPMQEVHLHKLWRPPHVFSCIVGYHPKTQRLYAGPAHAHLEGVPQVARPKRLDSAEWQIVELLAQVLTNRISSVK